MRLYLALAYLKKGDTSQAEQQLTALRSLRIDSRVGDQVQQAPDLLNLDLVATEKSREQVERDQAEWGKKFNGATTPEERRKVLVEQRRAFEFDAQ